MPTPPVTAYWLSVDTPLIYKKAYGTYLPDVDEQVLHIHCYSWMPLLCEKVKNDLIALGRWDVQHCIVDVSLEIRRLWVLALFVCCMRRRQVGVGLEFVHVLGAAAFNVVGPVRTGLVG